MAQIATYTEQTTVNGTDELALQETGGGTTKKIQVTNLVYPVGSVYVQYPTAESNTMATAFPTANRPATLFGGTWTKLYDDEAVFFRTEGTHLEASQDTNRTTGKQTDHMQQITGSFVPWAYNTSIFPTGAFSTSGTTELSYDAVATNTGARVNFDSANSTGARAGKENYPVNRIHIIWERTA